MTSDTEKIAKLLDALISRTQSGEVVWERHHAFATAQAYTTSLSSGSIMLRKMPFADVELQILDQAGIDVFAYLKGGISLRAPAVDADQLDHRLTALFGAVERQFSQHSTVVDGLLNELGA